MKQYYHFAGVSVEIVFPDEMMFENDQLLDSFRVDYVDAPYVYRFEMSDKLLKPVGKCLVNSGALRVYEDGSRYIGLVTEKWEYAYAQVFPNGRENRVLLKRNQLHNPVSTHTVLNILGVEHLVVQVGGVVFHSSYIEVDGKAILFTAPSGTGKSTQAALWQKCRNAAIHNGDRSAVRVTDGTILACGIPFAGSSQICENVTLPLAAIVYLKQAPQTTIRNLQGAEAFRKIWEGCSVNTWDRTDMEFASNTVMQVLSSVPVFELACTPDESAVIALEGALKGCF